MLPDKIDAREDGYGLVAEKGDDHYKLEVIDQGDTVAWAYVDEEVIENFVQEVNQNRNLKIRSEI